MMAEKNNNPKRVNFLHENFLKSKFNIFYGANKSKLESNWVWASGRDGSNNVDPIEMDPRIWIQSRWI